ncbi:MAG TPA: DUF1257 domain-containing protein [Mycobacteriales bacterium]|nr:DUF1257 domain-containing protein [Mycobacteriales bacterium]
MSHVTRVRTTLRDPVLLAAALRAAGFGTVEVHDKPQELTSRWGWTAKAEIILRAAANTGVRQDFGFARGPDGSFELVIDAMEQHRYNAGWLSALSQGYGYAATLRYAESNGYDVVTDEVEQDGTRRLTLRRTS